MARNLRQAVDVAYFMDIVVGQTEPFIIDSGINKHCYGLQEDPACPGRLDQDIHTIDVFENDPITAYKIMDLFENMQTQFSELTRNRSYSYQGIVYDENKEMWVIRWGS
jgi:hypothetical protein